MSAASNAIVRCAVYTRKSSDEGLEQGFNSLDAQREACAAYILSQASHGWTALPDLYDDGGISGGTLERPALKRLIADIEAGLIDIVVVYKVDRLSRSLLDFAKLVETFDRANVSFVSITQAFNTTTSMGRLTLNMLLSFAQFEREVTAERIRDKIAASKAKGLWMGGTVPLGYAADGRSLRIVEEHAAIIRHIFRRYLDLGSVRVLTDELEARDIRTPERVRANGRLMGNVPFCRGQLYAILKNPVYAGEIAHKDKRYPGLHDAIIDKETWDRVQAGLADNRQGSGSAPRARSALLAGRVTDRTGEPMLSVHSTRGTRRYRYYVSKGLHHTLTSEGYRIPARDLEDLVVAMIAGLFDDPFDAATQLGLLLHADQISGHIASCAKLKAHLLGGGPDQVARLVLQVRPLDRTVEVDLDAAAVIQALGHKDVTASPPRLTLTSEACLSKSGRVLRLVDGNRRPVQPSVDLALVRLIAKAHRWWGLLRRGETSVTGLAATEGVTKSYVTRVMRLAFLSPKITAAILEGKQSTRMSHRTLTVPGAIPLDWHAQEAAFLG